MTALFYGAGVIVLVATGMALSRANAVHALLYLIVSLLAVAATLLALGAPFAAALEVLVYAGAIMVLFLFVIMLMNIGPGSEQRERDWIRPRFWIGPALLAAILLAELGLALLPGAARTGAVEVSARAVGIAFFGPWLLAVELGSFLLLAALISAFHLGRQR